MVQQSRYVSSMAKPARLFSHAMENLIHLHIFNNYWMRLSGISRIIEAEVGVIRSRRLRQITLTEASIILDIPRKPNSIIILLFTWNYLSFMLCTNYSLELFLFYSLCENKKPDLLVLQIIIRKRDVIIAEYQELFADVTS